MTSSPPATRSRMSLPTLFKRKADDRVFVELSREFVRVWRSQSSAESTCIASPPILFERATEEIVDNGGKLDDASLLEAMSKALGHVGDISSAKATVLIPRGFGCTHLLEIPAAGKRDLAAVVDLEMESIFRESVDDFVWDSVELPATSEEALVLFVFSVPRQLVDQLRSVFASLQLEIQHISMFETGYAAALPTSNDTELNHAVTIRGNRLESIICLGEQVLQTHAIELPTVDGQPAEPIDFQTVAGTKRRLIASLPESLRTLPTKSFLMIADGSPLSSNSDLNPVLAGAHEANFQVANYSLIDAMQARFLSTGNGSCVDLANPRKRAANGLSSRTKIQLGVVTVFACLIGIWGWNRYQSSVFMARTDELRGKIASIDELIERYQPQLAAAEQLERWQNTRVDWEDQIVFVSKHVAAEKEIYVVRMQMDQPEAIEQHPVMRIEGRAKSSQKILALTRKLQEMNPALSIQPHGIEPNRADKEFSSQFRMNISVKSRNELDSASTSET